MSEHISRWLGAYYDGELQGARLRRVEAHLAECAACRAELESLRALSALLQESASPETITRPEPFVAQVGLRLPRRPERPAWQRALRIGWRALPAGLFGAWAIIQAVFLVTTLLLLALQLGLGGDWLAARLPGGPTDSVWNGPGGSTWEEILWFVLRLVSSGGGLGWQFILYLALMVVIGLLYASWLTSWWVVRKRAERQTE